MAADLLNDRLPEAREAAKECSGFSMQCILQRMKSRSRRHGKIFARIIYNLSMFESLIKFAISEISNTGVGAK